ncbi:hypothetical protein TNCV_2728201 [Trichonephila clavipes]|nr:hypothetical protein TNCV_2728201 [Trichonephila clavipes]
MYDRTLKKNCLRIFVRLQFAFFHKPNSEAQQPIGGSRPSVPILVFVGLDARCMSRCSGQVWREKPECLVLKQPVRLRRHGRLGWFVAGLPHPRLRVRFRPKSVDFHDAENRQRPCRMIMRHVKDP